MFFFKEAATLAKLSHPNIVLFMGVHKSKDGDQYMVFEYVAGGNVLDYLVEHEDVTNDDLLDIAICAARGMAYLEDKQIVHRDLACRNLLIDDVKHVKISDLGMARDNLYQASEETKVPIRWTAPEVLRQAPYTSKSDIWSFGVVLWEIFELGKRPFGEMSNAEVLDIVCKNGERLPKPERCSPELFELMKSCWEYKPEKRPKFVELLGKLEQMRQSKDKSISQPRRISDYDILKS